MKRRSFIQALFGGAGATALAGQAHARRAPVLLQESQVAGFQYHKGEALWPSLRVGVPLTLAREPTNAHDGDAVAVYVGSEQLGYVPQLENRAIAQMLDRGQRLQAEIIDLVDGGHPWNRVRMSISLG